MRAVSKLDCGFVIVEFPKRATITRELYHRLTDAGFVKMGPLGSKDYVISAPKEGREYLKQTADLIAKDFNEGKYSRELIGGNRKQKGVGVG